MLEGPISDFELQRTLEICHEAGVTDWELRLDDEHGLVISQTGLQKITAWRYSPAQLREIDQFVTGAAQRRVRVVAGTDVEPPAGT